MYEPIRVREAKNISSAGSQKGSDAVQGYSIKNQKGAIAIDFIQRECPSGCEQNILEY